MTNAIQSKSNLITNATGGNSLTQSVQKDKGGPSFADTLTEQAEIATNNFAKSENEIATKLKMQNMEPAENLKAGKNLLKFSNHALERMNTRGIHFTPDQITKIEQGMEKANAKGAKEALVLTDDSAMIVSLKNSTVVTVMDKSMLKENIFTKIDATVFV